MISKYLHQESKSEILTRDQRLHLKLRTVVGQGAVEKTPSGDKVLEFMDGEMERCDALFEARVRGSARGGGSACAHVHKQPAVV
jgi:hypothetical protein